MATRTLTPAPVELDRWRRDTPGCRDRIHLNNAGAGLMPRPVLDALTDHLTREAAIGGYEAADEAEPRVRETYALVARLVGAAPRNIALVENATVAFSQALSAFDFRPGDRIVTTRTDYPSNQLMYLSLAQRAGVETVRADDLSEGGVDPESVRRLARHPRTRLVALSWVPTNSGLVQDARAVGELGHERAWRLAALLRERLEAVPEARVLDRGRERCAIVTLDVRGRDAGDLELRLRDRGVNTSSADRKSGVLDMDDKRAATVLRLSPHYYNTEDELDAAVAALIDLVRR